MSEKLLGGLKKKIKTFLESKNVNTTGLNDSELTDKYWSVLNEDLDVDNAKRKVDKSKSELESIYKSEFPQQSNESSADYKERIDRMVSNYMAQANNSGNMGESVEVTEEFIEESLINNQNPVMTKSEFIDEVRHRIVESNKYDSEYGSGDNDYDKHLGADAVRNMGRRLYGDIQRAAEEKFGSADFGRATMAMARSLQNILMMEQNHKEELAQEAVNLIRDKYPALTEDLVDIDAEITGHPQLGGRPIQKGNIQQSRGTSRPPEGRTEEELKPEVTKRRIINGMTHGAARKGQNLFHMAGDVLNKLGPSAREDYSRVMAGNDFVYWALDRETIKGQSQSGQHAGNVRVEIQPSGKPKIVAQGMTFSFLLHELTKGVMELMSLHGTSEDDDIRKYVEDKTDTMEAEPDDIRLGVGIWEAVSQYIDIENKDHEALFYHKLVTLPAEQFNELIKGLVSGDNTSVDTVQSIADEASEELRQEGYDEAMGSYDMDDEDVPELDGDHDDGDYSDPLLRDLMGGSSVDDNSGEPDYSNMTKTELNRLMDDALDRGDYDLARKIGPYLA